jgi:hypothetical protein
MRLIGCVFTAALTLAMPTVPPAAKEAVQTELTYFDVSGGASRGRGRGPTAIALAPPDGVRAIPGGRATTNTSFESHIGLDTPLALPAIAAHYVSRLESARWRVESRLADGTAMTVTRLAAPAGTADPPSAVLTVTRLSDARVDLALRFIQSRPTTSAAGRSGPDAGRAMTQGARVDRPPAAVINEAASGEERLLREILLFDDVTDAPGQPYEIRRALPPEFPRDLLPAAAATGVVAVAPNRTTVVAIASTLALEGAAKFVRGLATAGWLGDGPPLGGFVRAHLVYGSVCRAPQSALLRFVPRAAGGTYVRASVSTDRCGRGGSPFLDVAMPMLAHPPGASVPSIAGGGGLDSHHWGMRITSGLPLAQLATYYVDQMSKSDWPLAGRVADAECVVTRHRSATISGEPVHAVLTLCTLPGEATIDAWLRVMRLAPR